MNISLPGRTEIVRLLLEYEADVAITDRDGWSALHFAAQNGRTELISILLEGNAQIDAQTKFGRTPLHCACASRNLTTVEALLSRGASITIKDAHGKTAMQACKDPKVLQIIRIFAQDQTIDFSQSMDTIAWYLPENKLMSMQSVSVSNYYTKQLLYFRSVKSLTSKNGRIYEIYLYGTEKPCAMSNEGCMLGFQMDL